MLCDELGKLLISIYNATMTVWGDNAHVTHVVPSPDYGAYGTILNVTISVIKDRYTDEEYKGLMEIFDQLVYNPLINSDWILTKVDIVVMPVG